MSNKNFPNGFLNWFETSVEISEHMFTALRTDRIDLDGRGQLWELIEDYTDEFEKKYKDVEWDGDWFDTVDQFTEEKIKLLEKR